jgi:hypothetical protein
MTEKQIDSKGSKSLIDSQLNFATFSLTIFLLFGSLKNHSSQQLIILSGYNSQNSCCNFDLKILAEFQETNTRMCCFNRPSSKLNSYKLVIFTMKHRNISFKSRNHYFSIEVSSLFSLTVSLFLHEQIF